MTVSEKNTKFCLNVFSNELSMGWAHRWSNSVVWLTSDNCKHPANADRSLGSPLTFSSRSSGALMRTHSADRNVCVWDCERDSHCKQTLPTDRVFDRILNTNSITSICCTANLQQIEVMELGFKLLVSCKHANILFNSVLLLHNSFLHLFRVIKCPSSLWT